MCKKKNSVHHGELMTQSNVPGKPATHTKLTYKDSREINIFPTAFCCALWKNVLLKNFIPRLLSALKAKERRKR